ncbi:glutathionylspermidine synthase family protein [Actinospica durhamensis]|uniref:Glutathionylspermidine synthase family protein n=1 Tax=Actinospica durhamensis TaxID=1508375 RepID=A0A941IR41_9ACTN|nr:glutathionylspermidine synthase family protein [Actinospica durhamensis]MBR7831911.1 glutathionylspermidine synthase family protein [Actinospica durhamensis]
MRRIPIDARPGWRRTVEAQGLVFATTPTADGRELPYWYESAYYALTTDEVDVLEDTAAQLHQLCLRAVEHVIAEEGFARFGITDERVVAAVRRSWDARPPSLYGRFDLAYDGRGGPAKLLEYNADTPTGLLEAAICQWYWLQDTHPAADQWNSLHERLVEAWRAAAKAFAPGPVHVTHTSVDTSGEEEMTCAYLAETAQQAGLEVVTLPIEQVGWQRRDARFVDLALRPIRTAFKLYPWEWIVRDPFGAQILDQLTAARSGNGAAAATQWIEPIWKMLLSNKALLAVLWELFPDHPNLLPAYLDGPRDLTRHVAKPLLGREGDAIRITGAGADSIVQPGTGGAEGWVHQQYTPLPDYDGNRPVLGAWVVAGEPAGLGIRESDGPVTDYHARFVPHLRRPFCCQLNSATYTP